MPAIIALGLAAAIAANAAIRTTQIEIPGSSQRLAIHCVEPSRPVLAGAGAHGDGLQYAIAVPFGLVNRC